MANGSWNRFKHSIARGLDINLALLVSSIVLVPYSVVATMLYGVIAAPGISNIGYVSLIAVIALGLLSVIIQLAVLGWVWEWLNRKEWTVTDWLN